MGVEGEKFLIAATLDSVEVGQEMRHFPPHMTIVPWFSLAENRWRLLESAVHSSVVLPPDVFQHAEGGRHPRYGQDHDIPVRELKGVELGPSFALRALIQSIGSFKDGQFVDNFSPHVSDTPERKIRRGESIRFASVGVFSRNPDTSMKQVREARQLGSGVSE